MRLPFCFAQKRKLPRYGDVGSKPKYILTREKGSTFIVAICSSLMRIESPHLIVNVKPAWIKQDKISYLLIFPSRNNNSQLLKKTL